MNKYINNTDETIIRAFFQNHFEKKRIINYFYFKYLAYFSSISYKYLQKFFWIGLEKHDLVSLGYFAVSKSINSYYKNNEKKFYYAQYLKQTYKFLLLDYLKKYCTRKYITLNKANYINKEYMLHNKKDNFVEDVYSKMVLENVFYKYFKDNKNKTIILKMKLEGYRAKEIGTRLNESSQKVNNIWNSIKTKMNNDNEIF